MDIHQTRHGIALHITVGACQADRWVTNIGESQGQRIDLQLVFQKCALGLNGAEGMSVGGRVSVYPRGVADLRGM